MSDRSDDDIEGLSSTSSNDNNNNVPWKSPRADESSGGDLNQIEVASVAPRAGSLSEFKSARMDRTVPIAPAELANADDVVANDDVATPGADEKSKSNKCEKCHKHHVGAKVTLNGQQMLLCKSCCLDLQSANGAKSDSAIDDADAADKTTTTTTTTTKQTSDDAKAAKEKPKKVGVLQLFRFARPLDVVLMLLGSLGAMGRGVCMPAFSLIFGDIIDVLAQLDPTINMSGVTQADNDQLVSVSLRFLYFAAVAFGCSLIQLACWGLAGERQTDRVRRSYLRAVLRQEVGWFDREGANEVYSRLAGDVVVIHDAISDKFGSAIQFLSQFVAGFALGFYQGWKLTLVILAVSPALVVAAAVMMYLIGSLTTAGQKSYAKAGAVALETLTAMRTVAAFGAEDRSARKYEAELAGARRGGMKKSLVSGIGFGVVMLLIYSSYALALWFGGTQIAIGDYTGGKVLTVLFAVLIGAFSLGQMAPSVGAISAGQGAAYVIYGTIARKTQCDPFAAATDDVTEHGFDIERDDADVEMAQRRRREHSATARELPSEPAGCCIASNELHAKVVFQNVHFTYPTRDTVPILNGVDLTIEAGTTVALVGASGCGKSTIVALLERFYEPAAGSISIDGAPLSSLNVHWWREQVGYVGQQPVLFTGSIAENIALGSRMTLEQARAFDRTQLPCSMEAIQNAAKMANAHDFIMTFPHGYDTIVGVKGSQLSGGQKQRIAIARALIRNPTLLLLDEATSALDSQSEAIVQDALDRAMKNRTTICIAHRLATIRNASQIYVFDKGRVAQRGTFDQLARDVHGLFFEMVRMQGLVDKNGRLALDAEELRRKDLVEQSKRGDGKEQSEDDSDLPPPLPTTHAPADAIADHDNDNDADVSGKPATLTSNGSSSSSKKSKKKLLTRQQKALAKQQSDRAARLAAGNLEAAEALAEQQAEDAEMTDDDETAETKSPIGRVFRMNLPEWWIYIFGVLFAIGNGIKDPIFSFVFSEMVVAFNDTTPDMITSAAAMWAYVFLYIGAGTLVVTTGQSLCFGVAGEYLTERVRALTFRAMLRQEVAFFDHTKSTPAVLTARLASDAALVQNIFGVPLGVTVQNIATASLGLGIAFYYGWKLTLVVLATVPVLIFGQAMEMLAMTGLNKSAQDDSAKATALATEAITEIRTCAALCSEEIVCARYERALIKPFRVARLKAFTLGLLTGVSQGLMFSTYTLNFWYGGQLIENGELTFNGMLKVFMSVLFSAMGMGQAAALMPDAGKARAAAASIFKIIDRKSSVDATVPGGVAPVMDVEDKPLISFRDVEFAYPTRKQVTVLRGMSVDAPSGHVLALCGESGCGKSTLIGLIERFYEPKQGTIGVGGVEIESIDVRQWRRQIGLVGQEPNLFSGTVFDNIAFGVPDEERANLTRAQVEAAAKDANAHAFIMKLPHGYDTDLGENGTQLSGGQKQRIAIARAIVRQPRLLLLDEATSALDSKSEKVVQDALDKAMHGRTVITIAHRLSTIRNADAIAVVSKGRVVELGKHSELLAARGQYYKLVRRQTADVQEDADVDV